MNNIVPKWLIYLALIAVGFYFGRHLGAIALPLLVWSIKNKIRLNKIDKAENKAGTDTRDTDTCSIDWAYELLGVSHNDDVETINKARKRFIQHYHPDRLSSNASDKEKKQAEAMINCINRAYEIIIQKKKDNR